MHCTFFSIFYRKVKREKEELEVMAKKEKDYLITISCLHSNLENMTKMADERARAVTELGVINAQLKEENKVTTAIITVFSVRQNIITTLFRMVSSVLCKSLVFC